jgi:hypothetical protein
VVDTGPRISGKKVMLPAGVISRVDSDDEKVYVNRTKDQIKNSPEFDDNTDDSYRTQLGSYYDRGGAGWQADLRERPHLRSMRVAARTTPTKVRAGAFAERSSAHRPLGARST